jgi:hypothetical protein
MRIFLLGGLALLALTASLSAQNANSAKVLALTEDMRNRFWTAMLQGSGEKCDAVVRTMYQGSSKGTDEWSVGCKNGIDYSISLYDDAQGKTQLMTCDELRKVMNLLEAKSGSKQRTGNPYWVKR